MRFEFQKTRGLQGAERAEPCKPRVFWNIRVGTRLSTLQTVRFLESKAALRTPQGCRLAAMAKDESEAKAFEYG
jgi:hypothetical protein